MDDSLRWQHEVDGGVSIGVSIADDVVFAVAQPTDGGSTPYTIE